MGLSFKVSDTISSGTSIKSGISSSTSSSINSNSGGTSTWLVCCVGVSGSPWLGCGVGSLLWALGGGGGMASLGISRMQWYSLLSSSGSSSNMGSFSSAIGRSSSSSESVADACGGVSSEVRHWQTPSQNGRTLGCLGVKGKSWVWAAM